MSRERGRIGGMFTFAPSQAVQRIAAHSQRPVGRPGAGVVALTSGDPDFETPPHIRRALIDAVESGYTHYPDPQGDPELRSALARQISARSGAQYGPEQVLMTNGGSGALTAAILATLNPGDRVLLPEPTYSLYADLALLVGAQPVYVRQKPDFHLDVEALEEAIGEGAKMVVLCHPCNPTGIVYRRSNLEDLGELATRHDLLVLADEAYDHIVYDGVEFVSTLEIPTLRDRLLYAQTFSKTYAMTGWRLGYLAGPAPIISAAMRINRTLNGGVNSAIQRAGLAAVTTESDWPERMRIEYQARRELVCQLLSDVPGVSLVPPEGAFYAFIHYDADVPAQQVVAMALEHGVAIRGGTEYGPSGANYVRVAYSVSRQQINEGLLRLRSLLASLDGRA
jgi:aspartate aminotransferase